MKRLLFFALPGLLAVVLLSGCGSTTQLAKDIKIQNNLDEALRQAQIDNTPKARAWADRSIAVAPRDSDTYLAISGSLDDTDRLSIVGIFGQPSILTTDAVGDDPTLVLYMKDAARKFPADPRPLQNLADAQGRLGDVAGQRATATQLAALLETQNAKPGARLDAGSMDMLAQAYCDAGNVAKGVADYQKVIQAYPADPGAYNNLAYEYAQLNDTANMGQALTLAQKAVALTNRPGTIKLGNGQSAPEQIVEFDRAGYQDTLGWVQYRLGKYNEALVNILAAANVLPRQAELRYHLGMVYLAQGSNNKEAAQAEFTHAALLSKGYQVAQQELDKLKVASAKP